ncbi:MAG: 50S ribosomal protein L25/general stress protein Ctc [Gammaproteobacteria bacterium]|nr:50S ribosomal protein L25/general stress protein Ctc [Gammaproteobacteria bacterium]
MAKKFSLAAEPRDGAGKGASRRLRRAGKVPGILYGGGKAPTPVMLDNNEVMHNAAQEAFFSSILDVNVGGEALQAIVKDVQVHPARRAVVHIDLQRILANEKIRMTVPLHFLNEALARGVKEGGGVVQHLMTEVQISCLPKDLPEFLTLDIIELELNRNLHLSDIKLPEGVEIPDLAGGAEHDRPVVSIHVVKEEVEEPVAAAGAIAEGAAPAEGAAAPAEGAAAASGAAKPGAAPAKAAAAPAKGGKEKK